MKQHIFRLILVLLLLLGGSSALGHAIGGQAGMLYGALAALCLSGSLLWFADRLVLRVASARRLTNEQYTWLPQMVRTLARRASIPPPHLYIIDHPTPNAFAVGRNPYHSAVTITTGSTQLLTREELAAVVAHELAHIQQRDTLLATSGAALASISMSALTLRQWRPALNQETAQADKHNMRHLRAMLLFVATPIAALCMQAGTWQRREYGADTQGAAILGSPLPLASALEKIDWAVRHMPLPTNPGLAALYFVNPIAEAWRKPLGLLHTLPDTTQRVARLRTLIQQHQPALPAHLYLSDYPEMLQTE